MQTIRIFISSPGDVEEERERAREVILSLRRRYAGRFFLKPVLWEDLALQADASFQQGIDRVLSDEHGIDVAVFILWSRMGELQDGGPYRSGTEREFDLMRAARERSPDGNRPALLVYTRADDMSFAERLRGRPTADQQKLLEQKATVERFIEETFQDGETGRNLRAYHRFDRPQTFSQRLRSHLTEYLDELAGGMSEAVWDIATQGAPFLGLDPYEPGHAAVFFGREQEILEARAALREQARHGCAFLLLSGSSGSGKSSLARAGVLPEIVENELDEQVAEWRTLVVTPDELGPELVGGLIARLADDAVLPTLRIEGTSLGEVASAMKRDPGLGCALATQPALAEAAKRRGGGVRVLLVLDQLERVFGLPADLAEERSAFLAMIEALCRSGGFWVLATMRSDFTQLAQAEETLLRLRSGGGQMDVVPPGAEALVRIVEEPARAAGLTFENRQGQSLASRILKDAATQPELLPLISFVLRELFEDRSADGKLRWKVYDDLGGVEGSVAKCAERTFKALPRGAIRAFDPVFQQLVHLPDAEEAIGRPDPGFLSAGQRRVRTSVFAGDAHAATVLAAFVEARLFTLSNDSASGEPTVMIAHESLLRVWPRLRDWILENERVLRMRARLQAEQRAWVQSGKRKDFLLPKGRRLKAARRFAKEARAILTQEEKKFVRASMRHAQFTSVGAWLWMALGFFVLTSTGLAFAFVGGQYWLMRELGVPASHLRSALPIFARVQYGEFMSNLTEADLQEQRQYLENAANLEMPDRARIYDALWAGEYCDKLLHRGMVLASDSGIWRFLDFDENIGNASMVPDAEWYAFDFAADFCGLAFQSGNAEVAERAFEKMLTWAPDAMRSDEGGTVRSQLLNTARRMIAWKMKESRREEAWARAHLALRVFHRGEEGIGYWFDHAEFALLCDRKEDAVHAVEQGLQQSPGNPAILLRALAVHTELGTPNEEEKLADQIAKLADLNCEAAAAMSYEAAKNGWKAAADRLITLAETRCRDSPVVHSRKGWSLIHLGDPSAGLAAFKEAGRLRDSDAQPSVDELAGTIICLWLIGEEEAARNSYRRLIALDDVWAGLHGLVDAEWHIAEARPMEEVRKSLVENSAARP